MKPLLEHCVPENFWEIAANNNTEEFNLFKTSIENARTNEEQYIHAFKGMLYMNEVVETEQLSNYNLTKVKILVDSRINRTFKFKYDVSLFLFP